MNKDNDKNFKESIADIESMSKLISRSLVIIKIINFLSRPPKWFAITATILPLALLCLPVISIWTGDWLLAKIFATVVLSSTAMWVVLVNIFPERETQKKDSARLHLATTRWFNVYGMVCYDCSHMGKAETFEWKFSTLLQDKHGTNQCMRFNCPNCKSGNVHLVAETDPLQQEMIPKKKEDLPF